MESREPDETLDKLEDVAVVTEDGTIGEEEEDEDDGVVVVAELGVRLSRFCEFNNELPELVALMFC